MIKQITEEDYNVLFKNGARVLFDWFEFRFLDGDNYDLEDEQSFIIIRFSEDEGTNFFQTDLKTMYTFVTLYHNAMRDFRDELIADELRGFGINPEFIGF